MPETARVLNVFIHSVETERTVIMKALLPAVTLFLLCHGASAKRLPAFAVGS